MSLEDDNKPETTGASVPPTSSSATSSASSSSSATPKDKDKDKPKVKATTTTHRRSTTELIERIRNGSAGKPPSRDE